MDEERKKEARKRFNDLMESLPEIPPCEHCDRTSLIGWCCQKRSGYTDEEWYKYTHPEPEEETPCSGCGTDCYEEEIAPSGVCWTCEKSASSI